MINYPRSIQTGLDRAQKKTGVQAMQRRDWNVSELAELLAALQEDQTAYLEIMRNRVLKKAGVEIPKNPMSPEFSAMMNARLSTRIAKRLKEDDRTVPLKYLSEQEIVELVTETMAEQEHESGESLAPNERDHIRRGIIQALQQMNASEEDPVVAYDATWRYIDAIEAWAVEHNTAPLAFFDQDDAHDQLLRRTQSKEEFLKERYESCCSAERIERMKKIVIEPMMLALCGEKSEEDPIARKLVKKMSEELLSGIVLGMRELYNEFVADADRIYWTDTHALPS